MAETTTHYEVRLGPWINWSQGRVLGATVTLTKRDAGFLISFIALFVGLVGAAFWRLACFGFHQWLSSNNPRDALYHQRQAVLRNTYTSLGGLRVLCQMLWAWRTTAKRPYARILPLAVFSLLTVAGFAIAGVFSSRVASSTTSEALVQSRICGAMSTDVLSSIDYSKYWRPWQSQILISAEDYARRCYSSKSDNEPCRPYVKEKLPMTVTSNASCPFASAICRSDNNIQIDTGLLDSREHFGLNSPERFQWRLLATCAPLTTEGYTKTKDESGYVTNGSYIQYHYGDDLQLYLTYNNLSVYDAPYHGNGTGLFTYQQIQRPPDENFIDSLFSAYADYSLGVRFARFYKGRLNSNTATFLPIPELLRTDADTELFFLSANSVAFTEKNDDPWFSAHTAIEGMKSEKLYWADEIAASVLGCINQFQACNGDNCTALAASLDLKDLAANLWSSQDQAEVFHWFFEHVNFVSIGSPAMNLGAGCLEARYGLGEGRQNPLPDTQWQLEVQHWLAVALATQQAGAVLAATGPSDQHLWPWMNTTVTQTERSRCDGQKIISDAYTSFNVLGLCIVFIVGGILIILSYFIEPLTFWIRGPYPARTEWVTNETFQLQRLAHEELGIGNWSHTASTVPVTAAGETLATLDIIDYHHPKLNAPSSSKSSEGESLMENMH